MQHLLGLNKEQREAAEHLHGPLLILAGAGAGKTKTITHRIVNLIKNGIAPEKILAVTFTNKAAKEMRERILESIKNNFVGNPFESSVPFISTFHSLGVFIIKENARILGMTKYFTILDEGDALVLIKESLKELSLDPKQYDPKKIKNVISREKGKFIQLEDYEEGAHDPIAGPASGGASYMTGAVAQVWKLYEGKKKAENSLDFDDLLLKTVKLLKDNEEIRRTYQNKWEFVHIDEYQDTNEVQYLMSKLLTEKHKNIAVVGDSDQLIYSWRGANLKNILNFEKDYPEAKIVLLEQNYRSTKNILEAANVIIKKNKFRPDKNLFTDNVVGEKIGLYEALDEADEADFVATKILEIMDRRENIDERTFAQADRPSKAKNQQIFMRGESGNIFSEIAVLYRANFQSRALEEAMLRYNIPYQVLGVKFFERREIKDTLAYLRAALNRNSLSDIKGIINFPARGIGKATLAKIFANDVENLPIKMKIKINNFYQMLEDIKEKIGAMKTSEVIKYVVKKSGIEAELSEGGEEDLERLGNIKELATLALKYDNLTEGLGVERLLEDAALASEQDSLIEGKDKKEERNAVKLMTVHASKGLEFKYVFIVGLEDGLFPHERHDEGTNMDNEEERRLFYVAVTRARIKLFLSFANFRTIFGSRNINTPSEFISDIPADLLEKEGEQGSIKTIYI